MTISRGAIRQRRHRARQRDGKIVIMVEADEVALTEQLVVAGFLPAADMDNRAAVKAALERVIAIWAQDVTRNDMP